MQMQDNYQVAAGNLPNVQTSIPHIEDAGAETRAQVQIADAASKNAWAAAIARVEQTNNAIADDALAQLKNHAIDLRYGDAGYEKLKGFSAMERPDGQSLVQEYGGMMANMEQKLAATLKNKQQEARFKAGAASIIQNFAADTLRYMNAQSQKAIADSYDSQEKTAVRSFLLAADANEETTAIQNVASVMLKKAALNGWDKETLKDKTREALSNAISKRADFLIDGGREREAEIMLTRFGSGITGEDMLKIRGKIREAAEEANIQASTVSSDGKTFTVVLEGAEGGAAADTLRGAAAVQYAVGRIIQAESGGKVDAQSNTSSAGGLGGFIDSTWLAMVKQHAPEVAAGKSNKQIITLKKTDAALARRMTEAYMMDNARALEKAGLPSSPLNIRMAHFFGADGAIKLLKQPDFNVPFSSVKSVATPEVLRANKHIRGKTIQQILDMEARNVGYGSAGAAGGKRTITFDTTDPARLERELNAQLPPKLAKKYLAEYREQARLREQAEKQAKAEQYNSALEIAERATDTNAIPKSLWLSLSPTERQRLQSFVRSKRNGDYSDMEEKARPLYYQFSDPLVLGKMTREQVQALTGEFPPNMVSTLLGKWDSLNKAKSEGKLKDQKVEKEYFNYLVKDVFGYDNTSKNKEKIGNIKFNFDSAVLDAQRNLGRDLTQQEQREIMERYAAVQYVAKSGLFSNTKESVLTAPPYSEESRKYFKQIK